MLHKKTQSKIIQINKWKPNSPKSQEKENGKEKKKGSGDVA
jgi:hypothetical protein